MRLHLAALGSVMLLAGCTVGPGGVSLEGGAGLVYEGIALGGHEDRFTCPDGRALVTVGVQLAGNSTVRVRVTDDAGHQVHDRTYGYVSGDLYRVTGAPGQWLVQADRIGDPRHEGAFSGSYQVDVDCGDAHSGGP